MRNSQLYRLSATLDLLAQVVEEQDRPAEAAALYARVLKKKEETLGTDHLGLVKTLQDLSNLKWPVG